MGGRRRSPGDDLSARSRHGDVFTMAGLCFSSKCRSDTPRRSRKWTQSPHGQVMPPCGETLAGAVGEGGNSVPALEGNIHAIVWSCSCVGRGGRRLAIGALARRPASSGDAKKEFKGLWRWGNKNHGLKTLFSVLRAETSHKYGYFWTYSRVTRYFSSVLFLVYPLKCKISVKF